VRVRGRSDLGGNRPRNPQLQGKEGQSPEGPASRLQLGEQVLEQVWIQQQSQVWILGRRRVAIPLGTAFFSVMPTVQR
jgi:hypothetical protein